jgi:hypothetical protein
MKLSSLYIKDIDSYEDIIDKIVSDIDDKFVGVGDNSISISKFSTYLRTVISNYLRLHYKKNYRVIITMPRVDEKLVLKDDLAKDTIKIRLLKDRVTSILNGSCNNLREYVYELIDQLDTELNHNKKFNFKDYLILQLDGFVILSASELIANFNKEYLLGALLNRQEWSKLANKSAIFNEYYNAQLINEDNRVWFARFLKKLYLHIKQ